MNKDKHGKKITHMSRRAVLLVLSVALILSVSIGGTLAYLIRETESKTNTFIPGDVTTSTEETFDNNVKTDVFVKNADGIEKLPVYVRAKIVFNWIDKDGETVLSEPVNMDSLEIDWVGENGNSDWKKVGDYYYYQQVLQPGAQTSNLIKRCLPKDKAGPVDARLQVTILTQSIQAYQTKAAVEAAWGANAAGCLPEPAMELPPNANNT